MIREYQEKDAFPLTQLWLESACDSHPFIPMEYWKSHMGEIQKEYLPQSYTMVWEEKEDLLGFISIVEKNWIGGLFLLPQAQGRGIGSALLESCKRNKGSLSLAVYCKNKRAVSFYQKHFFRIFRKVPGDAFGEWEYHMQWLSPGLEKNDGQE